MTERLTAEVFRDARPTMSWFGRNTLQLAAILNAFGESTLVYRIGSGPLAWFLAKHPLVEEVICVDNSHEVAELLWLMENFFEQHNLPVRIQDLDKGLRNRSQDSNTELSDQNHIEAGLGRLQTAGCLPDCWSYDFLCKKGIMIPPKLMEKLSYRNMDASKFLRMNQGKLTGVVELANFITQLLRVSTPEEMSQFYQLLRQAMKPEAILYIQTTLSSFLDQSSVGKKDYSWPYLIEQLSQAGFKPTTMVLTDAVNSRGNRRGSLDIFFGINLRLGTQDWLQRFNKKWQTELKLQLVTIGDWAKWHQGLEDNVPLVLQKVPASIDLWEQIAINTTELDERLISSDFSARLEHGRNIRDGLTAIYPEYTLPVDLST